MCDCEQRVFVCVCGLNSVPSIAHNVCRCLSLSRDSTKKEQNRRFLIASRHRRPAEPSGAYRYLSLDTDLLVSQKSLCAMTETVNLGDSVENDKAKGSQMPGRTL